MSFEKYPLMTEHLKDWLKDLWGSELEYSGEDLEAKRVALNVCKEASTCDSQAIREAAAEGLANFIDYQKFDSEIYHMAVALLREFAEDSRQDAPCKYAADHLKTYE